MGPQPVILGSRTDMNLVDGATIELRIRINRPDDENTRCKVSRAGGPRKDFSQCMQRLTTTFNVQRHLTSAGTHRAFGASALPMWREADQFLSKIGARLARAAIAGASDFFKRSRKGSTTMYCLIPAPTRKGNKVLDRARSLAPNETAAGRSAGDGHKWPSPASAHGLYVCVRVLLTGTLTRYPRKHTGVQLRRKRPSPSTNLRGQCFP
jgi:hypothetical protein